MSKQRGKGTEFENEMVELFHASGFPLVERAAQKGINDAGDLIGAEFDMVIECKKQNTLRLPDWIRTAKGKAEREGLREWVIFYADDRRLTDSVGTIAIIDAELLIGFMSFARDHLRLERAVKQWKELSDHQSHRVDV